MSVQTGKFKDMFRHRLIDAHLSVAQLAMLIGKSRDTVDRWMTNPQAVQPEDMFLMLSALKYTPEEVKGLYSNIINEYWR